METAAYLTRIQYMEPIRPDVQTLHGLQQAHMLAVPFENLDIGLKRPIRLDLESLWNKIVVQRRGGFCYELNGLFGWLLEQIGFDVTYLNARDYHPEDDSFGIDFDHLVLLVRVPNEPTRWLVDVGWGDSFTRPLEIDNHEWQEQGLRAYRLEPFRSGYQLWQRGYQREVERQYFFDLVPHQFPAEYEATCHYHQTSSQSVFTRKRIISRLTEDGRVSLDSGRLILTKNGQRSERPFENEDEFHELLKQYFDITL
jgi:N-hydroxyarylamine O-acetyltransferase